MTDGLREELARIGEAAAPVAVPRDVWARGRRARLRGRVVVGGAVLSVLVVLAGLGVTLRGAGHDVPPVAAGVEAVPSVIHPVPSRLGMNSGVGEDTTWESSVAETDLAVGRASVAFASSEFEPLPVVITAADGAYHLLDLPGWLGSSLAGTQVGSASLALSPDGRFLAWGWYDASTRGSAMVRAGVRVVDLTTGRIRTVQLSGGRGVAVGSVRWSPDSRWLVWQGMELNRWDEGHTSWQRNVAGRIAPGSSVSTPIAVSRGGGEQLAIDDHGTVGWVTPGGEGYRYATTGKLSGGLTDVLGGRSVAAGSFGPDGSLAFATTESSSVATFFLPDEPDPQGSVSLSPVTRNLPDDRFPADITPMGWLDAHHAVELVTPVHPISEDSWTTGDSDLVVMAVRGSGKVAYDAVAHVAQGEEHDGRIQDLTVAVDLMSLDRPTRDFPAPTWPWSDERKVVVFGGAGVAVVAALVFAVSYRRGRHLLR